MATAAKRRLKPLTKNENGPRLTLGAFFVPKHEIIRYDNK